MKVSFELRMPQNNSWEGKWSGEGKRYYKIMSFNQKSWKEKINNLLNGGKSNYWYYNFGDGWGASVTMEIVDDAEAKRRKKVSKGFCGYDWMVHSILNRGEIST